MREQIGTVRITRQQVYKLDPWASDDFNPVTVVRSTPASPYKGTIRYVVPVPVSCAVRDAQQHGITAKITRNGKSAAVLVPADWHAVVIDYIHATTFTSEAAAFYARERAKSAGWMTRQRAEDLTENKEEAMKAKMVILTGKPEIECVVCCHDYDSHNVDAADSQRNMPCRDCPGGTCRYPHSAIGET